MLPAASELTGDPLMVPFQELTLGFLGGWTGLVLAISVALLVVGFIRRIGQ